jgi:DNA-binding transcriptional MerR regulator
MEWSIQQVARMTGTTSRTLRHYGDLGLVPATRIGINGYRYYDAAALMRLQRVLLLRQLGLGLELIGQVISHERDEPSALRTHLAWLHLERDRLDRQIAAIEHTITSLDEGETPMPEDMFDGFDHTHYEEEVTARWGKEAYARSNAWWRGMSDEERSQWAARSRDLIGDWIALATTGADPTSPEAQALARRHAEWLRSIPGTPAAAPGGDLGGYIRGLAEMYVADERFAATYGGAESAKFVRDALVAWVDSPRPAHGV